MAKQYAERVSLKLNIGCGFNQKEGWVNIDLLPNAALSFDLREPIPLPSCSSSFIYSEHFLEHLDYPEDAKSFLAECYRLLEPGGRFSVGVPDTGLALREYAGLGDGRYFELAKSIWHPSWCRTRLEHINYHFRQDGEHRFAYDFETLQHVLAEIGFSQISQRSFDPTLDSEHRRLGTLYANAAKPR
jgi:predicted SAM-dependent methyltransferase